MRTDEKMAPDGAGAQVQDVEQPDNITGDAAAQVQGFLRLVFGDNIDAERELSLVSIPPDAPMRTRRVTEIEAAARWASARTGGNVYFGLSLVNPSASGRGKVDDMRGVGALWCDLDLAGPAHQKPNLASKEKAQKFVKFLRGEQRAPSITVHSGHGLQLYWLLRDFFYVADNRRAEAVEYVRAWGKHLEAVAGDLGFTIDPVWDLTRIFRLPGTVNVKLPDDPKPVRVLAADAGRRYTMEELDCRGESPSAEAPRATATPDPGDGPVEQADLPADKLNALLANDAKFAQTWHRERQDLKDSSPSGYDLSLASLAAQAEWGDGEIVALLRAWRTKHRAHPEKINRADYVRRTLTKARGSAGGAGLDRETALETIKNVLRLPGEPVAVREKVSGQQARFVIFLGDDVPPRVLNLAEATSPAALQRAALRDGVFLPRLKRPQIDNFAHALVTAAKREVGPTDADLIDGYVQLWLRGGAPKGDGSIDDFRIPAIPPGAEAAKIMDALDNSGAVRVERGAVLEADPSGGEPGAVYISSPPLCAYLRRDIGWPVTPRIVGTMLLNADWADVKFQAGGTTRRCWRKQSSV